MRPFRKFLDAGFRAKVLVPMITVMAVMLALTVWFVEYRTSIQVESDSKDALKTYYTVLEHLQANHLKYLRLRFQTLGNFPKYTSVFLNTDFKTINDQLGRMLVEEGLTSENIKFIRFTPLEAPDNAEPMIQPADASGAFVAASTGSVRNAESPGNEIAPETVSVDGNLYNIISIRLYTPEHIQYGVLTFGEQIDWKTASEYGTITGNPIVFIANHHVAVSSFPGTADKTQFESAFQALTAINPAGHELSDKVLRMAVGKDHFYCTSGYFNSFSRDPSLGYLLFSRCDPPESTVQTQRILLVTILIGILLSSWLVWFFVRRATEPLRELHDCALAVGRGDFSRRVKILSDDEFGKLAEAFNQMTDNVELSQAKLKHTVETLKTTQSQLIQSEKLSAVGEFVAGVAHELNNPLAAVMGFSEMLKNAEVGDKNRRHVELIYKSAERCQKIVQSLLSFARRQAPERKPVQVNKLIEDVLEMVAYPLRTSNVKVITHLPPKQPLVLADGHQIQQVVLNIINNARQAIEAHQGSGRITITTHHDAGKLRITIHDNGPGIKPENLRRIFDPFFTTKEVGKGTGLGLSLCYGIIHEHGGHITAVSEPGDGATFTIELPALSPDTDFEKKQYLGDQCAPDCSEGAGKKILAVDDEESLLTMIKEDLSRHSYEVTTVPNGETALRTLREKKFDLIVCDLKMPGINGRQVYERLREESPETCRRMVFVTGDIIGDQLRTFLEKEQRPCIAKPFTLGELRETIKTTLAGLS
jgi:two-component system NtrC family sensor kinase